MRKATTTLIANLNSGRQFMPADLYQLTLVNGTTLRYTQFDVDIIDGGNNYLSNSILIERSRIRTVVGVEVDTMELTVNPHPSDAVGSMTFLQACANGMLDGATLVLKRTLLTEDFENMGSFVLFSGRVADMSMTRSQVNITVKSDLELLNVKLPRNLYQATCLHTLYDGGCGITRASMASASAVISATRTSIGCSLSQGVGYFDLGYIIFTSGALTGVRRTVKSFGGGAFSLLNPLPKVPDSGDTFTAYAGCDRTRATCVSKFNNEVSFRAFPYIPAPETTR